MKQIISNAQYFFMTNGGEHNDTQRLDLMSARTEQFPNQKRQRGNMLQHDNKKDQYM